MTAAETGLLSPAMKPEMDFYRYYFAGSRIARVEVESEAEFADFSDWTVVPVAELPKGFASWQMHTMFTKRFAIVTIFSKDGN